MADDVKERIRERVDLAELIGETVALKPAGRERLKGLCPFHAEKTPSFHVHTGRGFYYCFGCGAKGDAISFVCETYAFSFPDIEKYIDHRIPVEPIAKELLAEVDPKSRVRVQKGDRLERRDGGRGKPGGGRPGGYTVSLFIQTCPAATLHHLRSGASGI